MTVTALVTPKGGQGCTVTTVALALLNPGPSVVADPTGDALSALGIPAYCEPFPGLQVLDGSDEAMAAADPDADVFVDAGTDLDLAAGADRVLLVLRPCYMALRRAVTMPLRPDGVILVVEDGRSLTASDVESCLGLRVVAEVRVDPAVARAVDAGILGQRVTGDGLRGLRRALEGALR